MPGWILHVHPRAAGRPQGNTSGLRSDLEIPRVPVKPPDLLPHISSSAVRNSLVVAFFPLLFLWDESVSSAALPQCQCCARGSHMTLWHPAWARPGRNPEAGLLFSPCHLHLRSRSAVMPAYAKES